MVMLPLALLYSKLALTRKPYPVWLSWSNAINSKFINTFIFILNQDNKVLNSDGGLAVTLKS